MKRMAIVTVLFSVVLAVPAFAADGGQPPQGRPPQGQEQTFEQRRAAILNNIDTRIANFQEERGCVEAAKNDEDLKACRERTRAKIERARQGRLPMGAQGQGGHGQDRQAPPPQDGGQAPY